MTMFAPHFPLAEFLDASELAGQPSPDKVEYAAQLSQLLERVREGAGHRPIVITSWLRDTHTHHGDGSGVDVRPPAGVTERDAVRIMTGLQMAGVVWGEFIVYPFSIGRHWHITLATRADRCQMLAQLPDGTYQALSAELVASFPTTPRVAAPAVASGIGAATVLTAAALLVATTRKRGNGR